jgi:hypothetical protein
MSASGTVLLAGSGSILPKRFANAARNRHTTGRSWFEEFART